MMPATEAKKVHILTIDLGGRFRLEERGPVYYLARSRGRLVGEPEGGGRQFLPPTFVIPADAAEEGGRS